MATAAVPSATDAPPLPGERKDYYEIVDGVRRAIPSMGVLSSPAAGRRGFALETFVAQRRLGLAVVEALFTLRKEPLPQRQPDVAFASFDRVPDPIFPPNTDPPAFGAIPNLAVEFVGSAILAGELAEKVRHYFEAGVQGVWPIQPLLRTVHVYDGPLLARISTEADELDGGAVLHGFRLSVAALFQTPARPQ